MAADREAFSAHLTFRRPKPLDAQCRHDDLALETGAQRPQISLT